VIADEKLYLAEEGSFGFRFTKKKFLCGFYVTARPEYPKSQKPQFTSGHSENLQE
jgi:hypothetical protein